MNKLLAIIMKKHHISAWTVFLSEAARSTAVPLGIVGLELSVTETVRLKRDGRDILSKTK